MRAQLFSLRFSHSHCTYFSQYVSFFISLILPLSVSLDLSIPLSIFCVTFICSLNHWHYAAFFSSISIIIIIISASCSLPKSKFTVNFVNHNTNKMHMLRLARCFRGMFRLFINVHCQTMRKKIKNCRRAKPHKKRIRKKNRQRQIG